MKSGISISTISFPPYYSFIQLADVSPPYLDPSVGLEPSSTRSMNPNSVLNNNNNTTPAKKSKPTRLSDSCVIRIIIQQRKLFLLQKTVHFHFNLIPAHMEEGGSWKDELGEEVSTVVPG